MAASIVHVLRRSVQLSRISITKRAISLSHSCLKETEEKVSLEDNPYFHKYADKIKELQRSDPTEFQSRLDIVKEVRKKKWADASDKDQKQTLSDKPKPKLLKPKDSTKQSLDSVVQVDLLRKHTTAEISQIWKDYHKDKDNIFAVIPSATYAKMHQRGQEYPMFLYPLPRKEGYEFFFAQFDGHNCHFTSIINYQAYQENAPTLLTITHYPELQEEKGIVLMRGEMDANLLSIQDAQFFANQVQLYYASDDEARLELLQKFNHSPTEFKHMEVITQLNNATVDLKS